MTAVFVHLSDIHFGQEKGGWRFTNDDARRQLIADSAAVVASLPNAKASGIIVTGDIAYAGQREEYVTAGRWLDELADRVGCKPSDIQMVPGNHDIDRKQIRGGTALMLAAIHSEGESRLDALLEEEADREVLYLRFMEYRRFADSYQCPLDCTGSSSADRLVEIGPGRHIRIVRLNSALICTKDVEEKGKLLLGARQRIFQEASGEELVVLAHHPLEWYADGAETKKFLRSRARVFVSGHEHLANMSVENVEVGRDLMLIAAGATTPDEVDNTYTYAYNIIEFDWDEGEDALAVTIHPRRWRDDMKRFEQDDTRLKGRVVLGSPNFQRSARAAPPPGAVPVAAAEPAAVKIDIPAEEDPAQDVQVDEAAYRDLYMRFFRDLSDGARLQLLAVLGVVPGDFSGHLNHGAESRLFNIVVRQGRFSELSALIHEALASINEETQQ
ncbi:3',5'-cyclic AMP phosphodiesterase CpdA [Variovorax sp. CF079]|uniref:metallophosphoesterase n=1 Tax=Variovorax sp. CF079 TaxID=1882774 RepID=UPI000889F856|nr:metallophosphoesterase [Variovorax sp. CF079]SDC45929.1 3',5'-cyclic AMP phosphodiesterase CpdA [Variovorax sp. CF079]